MGEPCSGYQAAQSTTDELGGRGCEPVVASQESVDDQQKPGQRCEAWGDPESLVGLNGQDPRGVFGVIRSGGSDVEAPFGKVSVSAVDCPVKDGVPLMTDPDRSNALDHVVVVMFENRSFDNLLGRLYEPGEVASFEGVLGKELSNPIPE